MRGIPSSFLFFFFALVFLVELISYFGIRQLIIRNSRYFNIAFTVLYVFISLIATSLLLYSFANPEVIRQARNYTYFYLVISVTFLNLFPKFIFTLFTLLSFVLRWIGGKQLQLKVLAGSFVISFGFFVVIAYGILQVNMI